MCNWSVIARVVHCLSILVWLSPSEWINFDIDELWHWSSVNYIQRIHVKDIKVTQTYISLQDRPHNTRYHFHRFLFSSSFSSTSSSPSYYLPPPPLPSFSFTMKTPFQYATTFSWTFTHTYSPFCHVVSCNNSFFKLYVECVFNVKDVIGTYYFILLAVYSGQVFCTTSVSVSAFHMTVLSTFYLSLAVSLSLSPPLRLSVYFNSRLYP